MNLLLGPFFFRNLLSVPCVDVSESVREGTGERERERKNALRKMDRGKNKKGGDQYLTPHCKKLHLKQKIVSIDGQVRLKCDQNRITGILQFRSHLNWD